METQFAELSELIRESRLQLLQFLHKKYPNASGDWIDHITQEVYLRYIRSPRIKNLVKVNYDHLLQIARDEIKKQEKSQQQ